MPPQRTTLAQQMKEQMAANKASKEAKEASKAQKQVPATQDNFNALKDYADKRNRLATAISLLGIGGGCFLAHKKGSGVWGYIGYGLLLGIVGGMIGSSVSAVVFKVPDLKV